MVQRYKSIIPQQRYFIDSGKFYIDAACFSAIKIPENFTLIDKDTGEALNDFKRSSLEIPYQNHKIYIAKVKKILPKQTIDKILIYFPAKVAGEQYFYGIQKQTVIDVLLFLQSKGYLFFTNVEAIYNEIYVKDLDYKTDFLLPHAKVGEVKSWLKVMQERFNGIPEFCKVYDNQDKGIGLQTYHRDTATFAKVFSKWYNKSLEIQSDKNAEFFCSLSPDLQSEIQNNLIMRYEFTLKDKIYFTNFGITNRLSELMELPQSKLKEIGRAMLDKNFQPKMKREPDTSKLKPIEQVLVIHFMELIERGMSIGEIKDMYTVGQKTKQEKYRMGMMFEKVYYNATVGAKASDAKRKYDMIKKWDKFFGFSDSGFNKAV